MAADTWGGFVLQIPGDTDLCTAAAGPVSTSASPNQAPLHITRRTESHARHVICRVTCSQGSARFRLVPDRDARA